MNAYEIRGAAPTNAALEHTFIAYWRESLALLEAAADTIPAVNDRYSKVKVAPRDHETPTEQPEGVIVGSSRIGGEQWSVVLTAERQLWAGRLVVRHDAKAESTVEAVAPSVTLDELHTVDLESNRTGEVHEAIRQVLSQPDALEQHLDRLFNPAPHR